MGFMVIVRRTSKRTHTALRERIMSYRAGPVLTANI